RELAYRRSHHHQYDPSHSGEGEPEIPRAVGGPAPRGGHPSHPRRRVGVDSLRVTRAGRSTGIMDIRELTVAPREGVGKGVAKRLRRGGKTPGILYGGGGPAHHPGGRRGGCPHTPRPPRRA